MKILFLLAGWFGIVTCAVAQPWQDRAAKILGDIRFGLPLEPIFQLPEDPPPAPWGPRSYYASGKLLNLSTRGYVVGSSRPLVTGISIEKGGRAVLIRAVGPSLSSFGVTDRLAEPSIELFRGQTKMTTSVPWSETNADTRIEMRAAATACGAFPLQEDSKDAVLLAFLSEGTYTCIVSGLNRSQGSVLVEVYHLQSTALLPPE